MPTASPSQAGAPTDTAAREIVVSRVFNAPREMVFKAWTDPDQVGQWWGPNGFTTTTREMDVRPGGVWRYTMHGPDGRDYPNRIIYDQVVQGRLLVYAHDDDGGAAEPISFQTTVTFDAHGDDQRQTKVTLKSVFPSTAERDHVIKTYGADEGGMEHLGCLAQYLAKTTGDTRQRLTLALPSEREVILRRVFKAPRRLVFEAMSKPEHVRNWWGCAMHAVTVCEMDFRAGGSWRIVQRTPDGQEHPFRGEYKEIDAPERVVQTFIYDVEGIRDHPAVETITLVERNGETILTNRIRHDSRQSRDAHLYSGMEQGATESMDRLEALVDSMQGV